MWEIFYPFARDNSAITAHVYALIKEVNHHFYVQRQTQICTTWPSFPFTCRLLFIFSPQITSFTQFFVHKNCFELFLWAHFLFLRNSQLESDVCRLPYTWSLNSVLFRFDQAGPARSVTRLAGPTFFVIKTARVGGRSLNLGQLLPVNTGP